MQQLCPCRAEWLPHPSNNGALLLREALDNSVIEELQDNLVDRRHPLRIRLSLTRTLVLQRTMGWIDLSDTRCMTPLAQERAMLSLQLDGSPFTSVTPTSGG